MTSGSTIGPEPSLFNVRTTSKGISPIWATATPSTNSPTSSSLTRSPAARAAFKQADSAASTATTLTWGATSPKNAAMPEMSPPPPTATNTYSIFRHC